MRVSLSFAPSLSLYLDSNKDNSIVFSYHSAIGQWPIFRRFGQQLQQLPMNLTTLASLGRRKQVSLGVGGCTEVDRG